MVDGNNQINFLSPETASRIRELTGASAQSSPPSPLQTDQTKKYLFNSIRQFRLLEDPQYIGTTDDPDVWESQAETSPNAEFQISVKFRKVLPSHVAGDIVYAVLRSDWEVLLYDAHPRIGRIYQSKALSANRWEYTIQPIKITQADGGFVPELADESTAAAYNLYETENLETGLLGNGIDLTGWVEEGAMEENGDPKHFLSPVPNGTLVFYHTFSLATGKSDDTGNSSENENSPNGAQGGGGTSSGNRKIPHIMVFQFANPLKSPFISHVIKSLPFGISGPSDSTEPSSNYVSMTVGGTLEKVYCPLLKRGESLGAGTKVVLSRNIETGFWEIIEAQCDSASAAALPEEDEGAEPIAPDDPPLDDLEDTPAADSGEDGETGGTEGGE